MFLEAQVTGINIYSAITLSLFTLFVIMYVDDTDIMITENSAGETSTFISTSAQHAVTTYQQGVSQTGGEVRPAKCNWYSIIFKLRA